MLPEGTLLQGRYLIVEHIGRGGMGAVYRAEDQRLHTEVALKQMLVAGDRLSEAFNREAQLLAALRHATIPRVIDHFIDQNGQFLVMEYIPGEDLATLLHRRNQPFGLADVVMWADQLLGALDYLHTHNPPIIHRDLKPQNLKLTAKNEIVLLDFGLAKTSLMNKGGPADSIFGFTPHYAPLEQIQGQGTDARTDLYSLAATLYHLLTGKMPVDAVTRAGAVVNEEADPLALASDMNPQVPYPIAAVLLEAMSLKGSQRPQSAAEMRDRLHAAIHDAPSLDQQPRSGFRPVASPSPSQAPTRGKSTIRLPRPGELAPAEGEQLPERRRPVWQLAAGGVATLALVGAGAFAWLSGSGAAAPQGQGQTSVATAAPVAVEPMSGSLNIAVADFTPAGTGCDVQPDEAFGLAMVVHQTLLDQMATAKGGVAGQQVDLGDIEIRSPEQTGALAAGGDRAIAAAALAEELNADVVLYGDVACNETPRQTLLTPQIYLSDRKLQSFDQLLFIGEHPFGSQLASAGLPTSGPTRQSIADGLVPRMTFLTQFLVGLDYYYAGLNEQAATAFRAATGVADFDDPFMTSMASIYQGTTFSRLQQYAEAQASYRKVLAIDPDNQTARYSLASALFNGSKGDCTPESQAPGGLAPDPAGLSEARALLAEVDAPGDSVVNKTIRGMAALGLGEIYTCMTLEGIADEAGDSNYWDVAEEQFDLAVQLLDQEGAFTRDFLAEAHSGLGLIYTTFIDGQDSATAGARWRRAAEEFCAASRLSGFPDRQADFRHKLAAIHGYLGEYDQAAIEREKAIAIDASESEWYDANMHQGWLAAKETTASKEPIWTCEQDTGS